MGLNWLITRIHRRRKPNDRGRWPRGRLASPGPWLIIEVLAELQETNSTQRRKDAKVLAELYRVRARQLRTSSAFGSRKTVSMSKLVSDSGAVLFPTRLSGSVPAHVARFPPASARFAYSRVLFNSDPSPGRWTRDTAERNPFASLRLSAFAFLSSVSLW